MADVAAGEVVDEDDVGAVAGRDDPTVAEPEGAGRRPGRRPVDGLRGGTRGDRRPDQVIDVALDGDVERVAVVGAQRAEGGVHRVDERRQGGHVLGHRAVADQHLEALAKLLAGLLEAGALVAVADAAAGVGVELVAGDERGVAVDMRALKGDELVEDRLVLVEDPREIHELGEADHLRMVAMTDQRSRVEARPGGL